LPLEISRFAISLAGPLSAKTVYNPFSGLNSFGVLSKNVKHYIGQEFNHNSFIYGQLRLIAHNKLSSSTVIESDVISNWQVNQGGFDIIISNPPFGLRIQENAPDMISNNCESYLIEKSFNSLSHNGKMILVISQRFLYATGAERHLREQLVERGWIEKIISIPGGILNNTSISLCILVINKSNSKDNLVHFVDANSFVEIREDRSKLLNDNALLNFINQKIENEYSVFASTEQIKSNDFNLFPIRYLRHEEIIIGGEQLSSILEIASRQQRSVNETSAKYVKIRDLKEDSLNFLLNIDQIETTDIPRNAVKIQEDVILVAARWKSLKPTFFKYNGSPIFVSSDIFCFKLKSEICDLEYLINELNLESFNRQADIYRTGMVVPSIRLQDFLSLKISLPSLEIQKAKVKGAKEANVKIALLEAENKAQAFGLENLLYENYASVKHSLGKPLLNINSSLINIEKAIEKYNIDLKKIKVSDRFEINIDDCFKSIYSNLELIHIIEFIKEYIMEIVSQQKPNITTTMILGEELFLVNSEVIYVNANANLLRVALNNIIDNANKHAFVDNLKDYKLQIKLGLSQDDISTDLFIKIDVSNNGKEFPEKFDLEKLVRKNTQAGTTGNTGIGGYDLNEIVKYLNHGKSTLDLLIKGKNEEFSTTYTFLIPIIISDVNEAL
jgi:type I restriction enzyme M protein